MLQDPLKDTFGPVEKCWFKGPPRKAGGFGCVKELFVVRVDGFHWREAARTFVWIVSRL